MFQHDYGEVMYARRRPTSFSTLKSGAAECNYSAGDTQTNMIQLSFDRMALIGRLIGTEIRAK